jgi:hypothetical protein
MVHPTVAGGGALTMPEAVLTVLYTQDLRGDLRALPRLFSLIQQVRADLGGRSVCIDLGGACAPQVGHCAQTGGRSMLMALDGCGYAAAYADTLAAGVRPELAKVILALQVVDAAHAGRVGGMAYVADGQARPDAALTVSVCPADQTGWRDGVLHLRAIPRLTVGAVTLDLSAGVVIAERAHPLTPDTRPDPTIAGMVGFIENEVRWAVRKRGEG